MKPVWQKIPRKLASVKEWKIIRSRWIDINKGDDDNPNYRSRMLGKEFNKTEIEGLFAATRPLEAFRLILSWVATNDAAPVGDVAGGRKTKGK